jgi:signal peptidase I
LELGGREVKAAPYLFALSLAVRAAAVQLVPGYEWPAAVTSGSMAPAMVPGDRMTVRALPWSEVRRGDIVEFRPDVSWFRGCVTHRVVGGWGRQLVTHGDHNAGRWDMGYLTPENYLGVVVSITRGGAETYARK